MYMRYRGGGVGHRDIVQSTPMHQHIDVTVDNEIDNPAATGSNALTDRATGAMAAEGDSVPDDAACDEPQGNRDQLSSVLEDLEGEAAEAKDNEDDMDEDNEDEDIESGDAEGEDTEDEDAEDEDTEGEDTDGEDDEGEDSEDEDIEGEDDEGSENLDAERSDEEENTDDEHVQWLSECSAGESDSD